MKNFSSEISSHYKILAGGARNYRDLKISKGHHLEGYTRRKLLMENALLLMDRAELKPEDLPAIAEIIHSPSSLLDENTTLWGYAASSNLRFHFAATLMRKGICDLSNKDVDLNPEEKEMVEALLRPIIDYGCGMLTPCSFTFDR